MKITRNLIIAISSFTYLFIPTIIKRIVSVDICISGSECPDPKIETDRQTKKCLFLDAVNFCAYTRSFLQVCSINMDLAEEKQETPEKNLSKYHFVHHKSQNLKFIRY